LGGGGGGGVGGWWGGGGVGGGGGGVLWGGGGGGGGSFPVFDVSCILYRTISRWKGFAVQRFRGAEHDPHCLHCLFSSG